MAYHESNFVNYTPALDCQGVSIWDATSIGGPDLSSSRIRHHRFPDNNITPCHDENNTYPLGIKFDLTNFFANLPTTILNSVSCWKIVQAPRDEDNKTVLDKGWIFTNRVSTNPEGYILNGAALANIWTGAYPSEPLDPNFISPLDSGKQVVSFFSPRTLLSKTFLSNASYLYTEGVYTDSVEFYNASAPETGWIITANTLEDSTPYRFINRQIVGSGFVERAPEKDPNAATSPQYTTTVLSFGNVSNIFRSVPLFTSFINSDVATTYSRGSNTGRSFLQYVSYKRNIDVFTDLDNLTYVPAGNCCYNSNDAIYTGDCFIAKMEFKMSSDVDELTFGYNFFHSYFESEVNAELRHDSTVPYFSGDYTDSAEVFSYANDKKVEPLEYNKDFSKNNVEKQYFQLPTFYDYCLACENSYPYRIYYSELSSLAETADSYKVFRPNNYVDLDGSKGEIVSLTVFRDKLYALTEEAIYFVPTRPQQLTSNEASVYIGTAEVLAIPPKKLVSTEYAYGGTTHQLGVKSTQYGVVFIDDKTGKIFILKDSLEELGMNLSDLDDGIKLNLEAFYKSQGTTYPFPYPTDERGIGFITTYDPEEERIIITKRDYDINTPFLGFYPSDHNPQNPKGVYIDSDTQELKVWTGSSIIAGQPATQPEYFKNLSWTLSFDLGTQDAISYHSYIPNFYFNDAEHFYWANYPNNTIYQHGTGPYQYYGDNKYPFIIEAIANPQPLITNKFQSIELISDVYNTNSQANQEYLVQGRTFTGCVLFTSLQTTGYQSISVQETSESAFNSVSVDTDNLPARRSNSEWHINDFRDLTIQQLEPVFTNEWNEISNSFPIDKVPNSNNYSYSKDPFQQGLLKDQYLGIRLYFEQEPTDNLRISTSSIITHFRPAHRS